MCKFSEIIMKAISSSYCVAEADILGSSRKGKLPEARKLACYFLGQFFSRKYVSSILGINQSNVCRFIKEVLFYIKRYQPIRDKMMTINTELQAKREELQNWLTVFYNAEPTLVFEKQQELDNIINQLNKE